MSVMPEYSTPDDGASELNEWDFALARRRDGAPVDRVASGQQRLADAITNLENVRVDARIEETVRTMRGVLDRVARAS